MVTFELRCITASTLRTYWLVVVCATEDRDEEVNLRASAALAVPIDDPAADMVVVLDNWLAEAVVALDALAAVAGIVVVPALAIVAVVVAGAAVAPAAGLWPVADFKASARARRRS